MAEKALPELPRDTDTVERWCAWATAALHADENPIVGAYTITSDDTNDAAVVIQLADRHEMLIHPARSLASRRIADEFIVRGCPVPYYTVAQVQMIGRAIGLVAGRSTIETEQVRSHLEFSALGAQWIERCRSHVPVIELHGRDGQEVRSAISRVRTIANKAETDRPSIPPVIFDAGADEWLVWTAPFRRYIREQRGTTSDELLGVQMQRAGWRRARLAARPGPGQKGTVELPVWAVPNGWQGVNLETSLFAGLSEKPPESVVDRSGVQGARAQAHTRPRVYTNDLQRPTGDAAPRDDWQAFRHAAGTAANA